MRKFAFVSDFDGTLTHRDFYHIVIDKYLGEWGKNLYNEWKRNYKIDVTFLNKVFGAMDRSEKEIREDILELPLDEKAIGFIQRVQKSGGKFYILSAGTSYYIKILLDALKIKDVEIISMEGIYKDRGIEIIPDKESRYYSEQFGIDKRKVVEDLKKEYEVVYFAGDSEPDLGAAKAAHLAFAKGELQELLDKEKHPYIPIEHFGEVEKVIIERGDLDEGTNS